MLYSRGWQTRRRAPFEIRHQIPGRMRLRVPALIQDIEVSPRLERALMAIDGMQSVRCNPGCASLVLQYRSDRPPTQEDLARALGSRALVLTSESPRSRPAHVAPSKPSTGSRKDKGRPLSIPRSQPRPSCRLCQMKLSAARWILADVWRCWTQSFTHRMQAGLLASITLLRF